MLQMFRPQALLQIQNTVYYMGTFTKKTIAIVLVKMKGGEATPSGWQPGSPTLKPGPDLVGNIWKKWKPDSAI